MTDFIKVFIVAGEESGDLLGARVMAALKQRAPRPIIFHGVGGSAMKDQGLRAIFPMEDLSIMGIAEVLPRLSLLMDRIKETQETIYQNDYDVVVTIDSPDFCFRVLKGLRKKDVNVPTVHYVAPSVWAWRPKRAQKISKYVDHLLCLLPFEPSYFTPYGIDAVFVGHSMIEGPAMQADAVRFAQKYGFSANDAILCLLPGSRKGELRRHLPVFIETAERLKAAYPHMRVILPTLPHLRPYIEEHAKYADMTIVDTFDDKYDAFAASTVALAASGTVTLELACTQTPAVVAYKMNPLTGWLAKMLVRTPFVGLVNIILGKSVMPEMLLENCKPEKLVPLLHDLFAHPEKRDAQRYDQARAIERIMPPHGTTSSEIAADVILRAIGNKPAHTS